MAAQLSGTRLAQQVEDGPADQKPVRRDTDAETARDTEWVGLRFG